MKYIKTMTQLKLSIWLALYIGWFMNAAVFFRRFEGYAQEFTIWKGLSGAVELIGTFLVTFFLLRILSLFGRRSGVFSRPSSYSSPPPPAIT
jgi:KDO II ethanolaminephosphotransferase